MITYTVFLDIYLKKATLELRLSRGKIANQSKI